MLKTLQIILMLMCVFVMNAQKRSAVKLFEEAQLQIPEKAEELYKEAIVKDNTYTEAYLALSYIYAQQQNYDKQIEILMEASVCCNNNTVFLNAQLAKAAYLNGEYELANIALGKIEPFTDKQLLHLRTCVKFSIEGKRKSSEIDNFNLGSNINTEYHDYWPSLSIDEERMVTTVLIDNMTTDGEAPQEDFYISEKINGNWGKAKMLSPIINTEGNEGAQCLSADGNIMLYTACNRRDGYGACDIFITTKKNGVWSLPEPLPNPINTSGWEGHPSLSADGRCLFFSSDRRGGYGGQDLYVAELELGESVTVKNVKNLGSEVNTDKNEISPFIHSDGKTLYFSSNGHVGYGRHDIFSVKRGENGVFNKPSNLGYPINTHNDEIGFIVNAQGDKAYFATEREDSRKKDIYTFTLPSIHRPQVVTYFEANIIDVETSLPLPANVELYNIENNNLIFSKNKIENVIVPLPQSENYALNVSCDGYLFFSEHFPLKEKDGKPIVKTIKLSPLKKGETLILRNVLFSHDSSELDTSYTAELHKTIALIKNNPSLKFEISGHTDNSGRDDYNMILSEKRAKTIHDYFILNGVNAQQVSCKGYGSKFPISDIQSENRRTELLVK